MIDLSTITPEEKTFLKDLKTKGSNAQDAFSQLEQRRSPISTPVQTEEQPPPTQPKKTPILFEKYRSAESMPKDSSITGKPSAEKLDSQGGFIVNDLIKTAEDVPNDIGQFAKELGTGQEKERKLLKKYRNNKKQGK